MADVKVYYCIDLNNENSELVQIKGKFKDGNVNRVERISGSETTLKELYALGYRIVDTINLTHQSALDQLTVCVIVERT